MSDEHLQHLAALIRYSLVVVDVQGTCTRREKNCCGVTHTDKKKKGKTKWSFKELTRGKGAR
jgi:hypothetical protein